MITTEDRLDAIRRVGRALADPTRARILLHLAEGPCYPSDLADHVHSTRANVSNHLACLRGCGLVVTIPEGRQVRYELAHPGLAHALGDLLDVVLMVDDQTACAGRADDVRPRSTPAPASQHAQIDASRRSDRHYRKH